MLHLRPSDYRVMPWKDGGGSTTEIAIEPAGASLAEPFLWRVSSARVEASGPFSRFPGRARLLTLRVRLLQGKWVEFSVVDAGPGIDDEVARQLFAPFFTTKVEGMGLGLSLCRTVIEQHGGVLGFEPVLPQGTVFSFTLPAAQA